jgi:RNA polymerase sigma-70 factor, ECF subfamily
VVIVKPDPSPRAPAVWSLDDAALLVAVREGDPQASESLYERLHRSVDATVRRLLGRGDADLEDCVQSSFVEIVQSIDRFRGESSLEHWASTIAAHVVYKRIRRRRLERSIFDRGDVPNRPEGVSTGRRLVARDLARRVRDELGTLPAEKVHAFLLHDVVGLDLREIAQMTGVTVAAAQKRVARGRREVHEHLASDAELSALLDDLDVER